MVEISPFKGITYNKDKIQDLDDVMSPPYDIISEKMQSKLYAKHPYNFVRLILGKQFESDTDKENQYSRAKKQYEEWLSKSILKRFNNPGIFPYKIEYKIENETKVMNGFFVLLKLDPDYKKVKAHERTLSKPKADRLNLMRACHSNLEPIQLLYIDQNDDIRKLIDNKLNDPYIDVEGYDGFKHKLWRLEDKELISQIKNKLDNEILFIADGHHRYQTAINYATEMKEKTGNKDPDASFNYRLVILANMFDEGLSIFPTHRLIKMENIEIEKLIEDLEQYFIIEEKPVDNFEKNDELSKKIISDLKTDKNHKFVLYTKGKYYILTLKDESIMDEIAADRSKTWRTLDVSILHKIILEKFMEINQENLEDHVKYTRENSEAIEFVNSSKFDLSFLMNPTKIEELKSIADTGEHMPQKSTYFLPKMLSGLVMYKMD
jgi:uncharacterized protein (DUF1015 family)